MGPLSWINLLHADSFDWTLVDADTAVDTFVRLNNRLVVVHRNGLARTRLDTGLARCTLFTINFCRHYQPFQNNNRFNIKVGSLQIFGNYYKTFFEKPPNRALARIPVACRSVGFAGSGFLSWYGRSLAP